MATSVVTPETNSDLITALKVAAERLATTTGELGVDFSCNARIDTAGVQALELLLTETENKGVKLVLHDVNVDVYKVLKLAKLAARVTLEHASTIEDL
jgi:anti-anti-sigma regulatory factor